MSERKPPRGRSIRRADARRLRLALLTALTTVTAGVVGLAQALAPGDLEGAPRLGQPLRLDFPLSLEPGESTDGLQVSVRARPSLGVADDEAWLKSPFRILLTDRNGRPTLRICNEQLVQEPMLELRLALRSAAGVITRRRYDVLVDPALAGVAAVACEPADAAATTSRRRAPRPPIRRPAEAVVDGGSSGQEVRVVRGDTLGELAQAVRGDHAIALPLMTDALYRTNRDAFIDNPDRLRAGSRLRIPDLDALARDGVAAIPANAGSSEVLDTARPEAAIPPPTPPEAAPTPWHGLLTLSYRLSTLPSLSEQRGVAQRYMSTVEEGPVSAAPARIDETRPSASVGVPIMPLFMVAIVALLGALLWMLRGMLARRPRAPRPATATAVAPAPEAAVAATPANLAKWRPAPGRTAEAPEEVGRDFYEEVANLLIAELRKNPQRSDLRFRLLELYFTSGKRDAFVEQTHDYLRSLDGTRDESWPEIVRMGRQIAPETNLYSDHASDGPRANVIPLQGARTPSRRFYEDVDPVALRDLREHLDRSYAELRRDSTFWRQLATLAEDSISPHPGLVPAERLTQYLGGAQILFRDERRRPADESAALVAVGQVLLARRVGYARVVAGGMRSRHALLVAQTAQKLGIGCDLHLSSVEQSHHAGALERLMGSQLTLHTVEESVAMGLAGATQLQALREALRSPGSMYVSPAAAGPPPYPTIVTDLAALLGRNLRAQMVESLGRAADVLIMNRGDGLNTIGLLETFLDSADTRLLCIESDRPAVAGAMLFPREHRLLRTTGRVEYQHIAEETARFITQFCAERQYAQLELAGSEVFAAALRVARDLPTRQAVVAVLPPEANRDIASTSEQQQRLGERLRGIPTSRT